MNPESNLELQETRTGKSTGKRVHRANRHRPVLVTGSEGTEATEQTAASPAEASSSEALVASEEVSSTREPATPRRGPKFFSNVGKTQVTLDQKEADPRVARLSRALRGKPASSSSSEPAVKEQPKAVASAPSARAVPPRTRANSGFKMKYIWGMMIYLLVADFLGVYVTNFMTANHIDATLFTWGPIIGKTSTIIFLAILVIILIVMARFDLLPRSFGAMAGGTAARGTSSSGTKNAPTFSSRNPPPTMKQGIQGDNDDLYKEYRANQRYFQKRDRKR